ncbi:hypothetical protein [Bacillus mycoides]|uniref:hypothetical protein n=1 Tax=Bacillus mycoides TaxID=1405 RepID=UPI001C03896C|nr:hypothetical protein [Bacillus mycoides]QWG86419.1 hypothetical protein EXW61_24275 [Bacillus mycoides]
MEEAYKEVLIQTVCETYPKYYRQKIIKQLEKENLVYFSEELFKKDGAVDLFGVEEPDQLTTCIKNSDIIAKKIEEMEFVNSYKSSVIFSVNEIPEQAVDQLISRGLVKNFYDESFDNDVLFKDLSSEIVPTKYDAIEQVVIFKFSRLLTGYLPVEINNKREIKYPILAIFYKDLNILEIRLEKAKGFLKNSDEYFYAKQVELIKDWFEENLGCEIEAVNLSPVVDYISRSEGEEVYVSAQAMNLKSKKKAVLDTGDNDEDILPLLGELKELIKANQELFNKNTEIKELLENFILETEETSDLPWISLTWKNESKSNATKVKFNFNYMNKDYSLLQYYFNNKTGMERMNNVTRYLIENKRLLEETECED